jgi:hypothetical protein
MMIHFSHLLYNKVCGLPQSTPVQYHNKTLTTFFLVYFQTGSETYIKGNYTKNNEMQLLGRIMELCNYVDLHKYAYINHFAYIIIKLTEIEWFFLTLFFSPILCKNAL